MYNPLPILWLVIVVLSILAIAHQTSTMISAGDRAICREQKEPTPYCQIIINRIKGANTK
jgi:cell division protein FtsL